MICGFEAIGYGTVAKNKFDSIGSLENQMLIMTLQTAMILSVKARKPLDKYLIKYIYTTQSLISIKTLFLSHLLIAGCDIGVQISVRPFVRSSVRSFVRPSVNIYVEV